MARSKTRVSDVAYLALLMIRDGCWDGTCDQRHVRPLVRLNLVQNCPEPSMIPVTLKGYSYLNNT